MKKLILLIILFGIYSVNAQPFKYKMEKDLLDEFLDENTVITVGKNKKIWINEMNESGKEFYLVLKKDNEQKFISGKEFTELDLSDFDPQIKAIILDENKKELLTFTFKDSSETKGDENDDQDATTEEEKDERGMPSQSIQELFEDLFVTEAKPYGLIVKSGATNYLGAKYVHIFLDQYGNLLNSTIPQGVADKQYVVHTLYVAPKRNREIFYSIRENKSSFNPSLRFNNEDFRKLMSSSSLAISSKNRPDLEWYHQEILLSTSTTDIEFELYLIMVSKKNIYDFQKKSLNKFTIKMSPTYHGTFDIGLLYSSLENPRFEILPSPVDPTQNVVKKTDAGKRGVVTAMATFYTSPIVLIEKYLLRKDIPQYKLSGRNFLDDHAWYERIYPTIGVGFSDKTFENLFYGFNWEFARGGSVFFGWHLAKIDYLNVGSDFKYEETYITEADYNLKRNKKWQTSTAVGVKLDVKIILGLFGKNNDNSQ